MKQLEHQTFKSERNSHSPMMATGGLLTVHDAEDAVVQYVSNAQLEQCSNIRKALSSFTVSVAI